MAVSARPLALVTGASRGIGRHQALGLARAGFDLALVATDAARLEQVAAEVIADAEALAAHDGAPPEVLACAADVTDIQAVDALIGQVVEAAGRIDVLVNAAGVIEPQALLWEQDPADWWRTIEVNVRGPYLLTRAVVPLMITAGGGRIINLNSGSGTYGSEVNTAYHASKTALARITEAVHLGAAGQGVLAFDLMPGVVRTDMTVGMPLHEGRSVWTDPADVVALTVALADGTLDAFSGRFVRAGVDTVASLLAAAAQGVSEDARHLRLRPFGADDPLAG